QLVLSARLITFLTPAVTHAVTAQLPEDMRNNLLKALWKWQQLGELEFMLNGEYIPDAYIMTGEWPELFPRRLRKCALCNKEYKEFDYIEYVDEDLQSSSHQDGKCREG